MKLITNITIIVCITFSIYTHLKIRDAYNKAELYESLYKRTLLEFNDFMDKHHAFMNKLEQARWPYNKGK